MNPVSTNPLMLAHNVFFTLKDPSPIAEEKLIGACHTYLKDHPGTVFYAAGSLANDLKRDVNDQDFHVGLHIIFKDRQAHDDYQESDRHKSFIEENKDDWAKVRVFDSVVGN